MRIKAQNLKGQWGWFVGLYDALSPDEADAVVLPQHLGEQAAKLLRQKYGMEVEVHEDPPEDGGAAAPVPAPATPPDSGRGVVSRESDVQSAVG